MDTTICRYVRSNPQLMTRLIVGETVDVGDGLSITLMKHSLYHSGWDKSLKDCLEFCFSLEGKIVGHLDHELGGFISPNYRVDGPTPDEEHDDFRLQGRITDKMILLFPEVGRELFGDEVVERVVKEYED